MRADRAAEGNGFTLLEVVVALVIASLALVVLFRAGGGGLFAVDTAARAEEGSSGLSRTFPQSGTMPRWWRASSAEMTAAVSAGRSASGRWRGRQALASDGVSSTTTTLFAVEVTISWPGHAGERSVLLRTLRLGSRGGAG